ncbi:RNA-binding protein [Methylobacterium planeticum]|uniref:RNA-binding protein n=1 Tax=Methylobacterium planeticum TaxID=2615211 RepID=A0A6N6MZ58_9HYPH|nr:RNA-binding protein [Methylobacterium planeticum]KAB1074822.1 RNA-binding protein [Methylobacterium planeticum]
MSQPGTDAADGPAEGVALDAGPLTGRHGAERTCIVTRVAQPPAGMVRFVLGPEGRVVPDLRARLPGRGAWISARREAVAEAVRKRLFQRAFKTRDAGADADLADRVAAGLRDDLRQGLALANKAGCVVAGFAKVEAAIGDRAGVAAVIQAADGSPDGRRKIVAALHRRHGNAISRVPIIDDLSNEELDMALGRDHVIHAALVAGVGAAGCLSRWRRYRSFQGVATTTEEPGSARDGEAGSPLLDDDVTDLAGTPQVAGSWDDGNPQGLG